MLLIILLSIAFIIRAQEIQIIGGTISDRSDPTFHSIVSLQGRPKKDSPWIHSCGGSIIHPHWILTAAHCVKYGKPGRIVYNTYSLVEGGSTREVTSVVINPDYLSGMLQNDIALMYVKDAIPITPSILNDCSSLPAPGDNVTVAGWGRYNDTSYNLRTVLYEVTVPVVPRNDCYKGNSLTEREDTICAGNLTNGGKDSCNGDSGGPLIYRRNSGVVLAGVVSWGRGCAAAGNPGVYTRISKHIQWIKSEINSTLTFSENCPTPSPTTSRPTTRKPTKQPTTKRPTPRPTTKKPTTGKPTKQPTTVRPTISKSTGKPTLGNK